MGYQGYRAVTPNTSLERASDGRSARKLSGSNLEIRRAADSLKLQFNAGHGGQQCDGRVVPALGFRAVHGCPVPHLERPFSDRSGAPRQSALVNLLA